MLKLICTRTRSTCRKAVALLEDHEIDFSYREYRHLAVDLRVDRGSM